MSSEKSIHSEPVADQFAITASEAFILGLAKFWLMREDADSDPDEEDREVKQPLTRGYAQALHRAYSGAGDKGPVPLVNPSLEALVDVVGSDGWADSVMSSLGSLPFEDAEVMMANRRLLDAALETVSSRERSVLILVEMSSFYPWPGKVKYEKRKRRELLDHIADQMPKASAKFAREIDRALRRRITRLTLKNFKWRRFAAVAGGGAVIGLMTGGLAAPAVGAIVGTYALGLSGAAATSAGLAMLGGGSLAAGGAGMAGGTLMVAGVAGFGAGATGAARVMAAGANNSTAVLADMAKLEVLTEYALVRGRSDEEKRRSVVAGLEQTVRDAESALAELAEREARLSAQVDKLKQALRKSDERNQDTANELASARKDREDERRAKEDLKRKIHYWNGARKVISKQAEELALT